MAKIFKSQQKVCHFWAKTQKSTDKRSQSLSYINWSLLAVKNKIENLKYTFSLAANNFSSFFSSNFFVLSQSHKIKKTKLLKENYKSEKNIHISIDVSHPLGWSFLQYYNQTGVSCIASSTTPVFVSVSVLLPPGDNCKLINLRNGRVGGGVTKNISYTVEVVEVVIKLPVQGQPVAGNARY